MYCTEGVTPTINERIAAQTGDNPEQTQSSTAKMSVRGGPTNTTTLRINRKIPRCVLWFCWWSSRRGLSIELECIISIIPSEVSSSDKYSVPKAASPPTPPSPLPLPPPFPPESPCLLSPSSKGSPQVNGTFPSTLCFLLLRSGVTSRRRGSSSTSRSVVFVLSSLDEGSAVADVGAVSFKREHRSRYSYRCFECHHHLTKAARAQDHHRQKQYRQQQYLPH